MLNRPNFFIAFTLGLALGSPISFAGLESSNSDAASARKLLATGQQAKWAAFGDFFCDTIWGPDKRGVNQDFKTEIRIDPVTDETLRIKSKVTSAKGSMVEKLRLVNLIKTPSGLDAFQTFEASTTSTLTFVSLNPDTFLMEWSIPDAEVPIKTPYVIQDTDPSVFNPLNERSIAYMVCIKKK